MFQSLNSMQIFAKSADVSIFIHVWTVFYVYNYFLFFIQLKCNRKKELTNNLVRKSIKTQHNLHQCWPWHQPRLFKEKMLQSPYRMSYLLNLQKRNLARLHYSIKKSFVGNHKLMIFTKLTWVRLELRFIKLNKSIEIDAISTVFKSLKRPST